MSEENDYKDEVTNPLGIGEGQPIEVSDDNARPENTNTKIDLGEDLLEQTKLGILQNNHNPQDNRSTIDEELANAEILINERIYDEAKKIYRKIIRKDPTNLKVKTLLQNIQDIEIQELLNTDNRAANRIVPASITREKPTEELISDLEKDLRINLSRGECQIVPDLFPDEATESSYISNLIKSIELGTPQDQIDIGVAQLEMGLHGAAKAVFEELIKNKDYATTGMYLLGHALINAGEYVEATIRLEPLVRDLTMPEDKKADFLYLMGIAFEQLNEVIKSKEFFRRVYAINPRYRDVVEKIR